MAILDLFFHTFLGIMIIASKDALSLRFPLYQCHKKQIQECDYLSYVSCPRLSLIASFFFKFEIGKRGLYRNIRINFRGPT